MEELLPFSVKSTEYRLQRRLENGLRVKGTGVGQRVKGKESERTMKGRYVLFLLVFGLNEGTNGIGCGWMMGGGMDDIGGGAGGGGGEENWGLGMIC